MGDNGKTIRLLAERQMGAFLKAMPKAKGGPAYHKDAPTASSSEVVPSLREIGITQKQNFNAQKLADIPEPEFKEQTTPTLEPTCSPC